MVSFILFFKAEGNGNGIKQAISHKLTGGYVQQDEYLQQTNVPVEGSCVFRLNSKKGFVLMYDMYGSGNTNLPGEDLQHFKVIDEEISMNFHPRHGTVISITNAEAKDFPPNGFRRKALSPHRNPLL